MDGVALHPQGDRLDQRRAAALARLLDRVLRLAVDGEHVGAVDDDALEAVGGGAVGEVLDRVLEMGRRRVGPLVVVDHEDDGQAADAGEVHPLVRVTARRRALAAPGDRDAGVLADAERERHPHGDGQHRGQVADLRVEAEVRVAEVDVPVASARRPVHPAHVLGEDPPRLDAAGDVDAHVALERGADVVSAHRRRDADGRGLVAPARVERAGDLALPVEDVAALLDAARDQEVAVDAEQILAVESCVPNLAERADGLRFSDCHRPVNSNGSTTRDAMLRPVDTDALLAEQVSYYRARAAEYDDWWFRRGRYDNGPEWNAAWFAEVAEVEAALERFDARGDVLELACGTGLWTQHLARTATRLTAVDASPEVIELNRARVGDAAVAYLQADIFDLQLPGRYDECFFGFWLSHVPDERFAEFWDGVGRALRPGGRVFFVDSGIGRSDRAHTRDRGQRPSSASSPTAGSSGS